MIAEATPFATLLDGPEQLELVFSSLEHTIWASFGLDTILTGTKPQITDDKVKSRWLICEKWFRIMRGDLGYGLRQTLDQIPRALACELIGQVFVPQPVGEHGWAPESVEEAGRKIAGLDGGLDGDE